MKKTIIIAGIWKLTLLAFVFVQAVGVIVVASVLMEADAPVKSALLAYAAFLIFSGIILVVSRKIFRLTRAMHE